MEIEHLNSSTTLTPDVQFQLSLLRLLSDGGKVDGQIEEIERLVDLTQTAR